MVANPNDRDPKWASIWMFQLPLALKADDPSITQLLGECEVRMPPIGVLEVVFSNGLISLVVGVFDGEEGPVGWETRKFSVRNAGERFPLKKAGEYVGSIQHDGHTLFVFETSDGVLDRISSGIDRAKALRAMVDRLGSDALGASKG